MRGCLFSIVLYFSLATGYYFWLDHVFDRPESIYGAAVASFLTLCCIGALINARTAAREAKLAQSCESDLPLNDGEIVAISGVIHAVGEPVIAPFSEKECVLCEYDVCGHDELNVVNDPSIVLAAGFMMNPCVIRTRRGDIRLLGFPHLDGFMQGCCTSYYDVRAARDFFATTTFEDMTGWKVVRALGAIKEVWSDDDGHVRKHLQIRSDGNAATVFPEDLNEVLYRLARVYPPERPEQDPDDDDKPRPRFRDEILEDEFHSALPPSYQEHLTRNDKKLIEFVCSAKSDEVKQTDETQFECLKPLLREKRIAEGKSVTAIGVYNAKARGLIPMQRGGDHFIRLHRGKANEVFTRSHGKVWTNVVGAIAALLVIHGVIWGAMELGWRAPDQRAERAREMFRTASNGDLPRLEKLLWRGEDINLRDEDGKTMLIATRNPAVEEWLIDRGIDVNATDKNGETALMNAAKYGQVAVVRKLIAAKANLNARHREYNTTALMMADSAYQEEQAEVAKLLRAAGAVDEVVTAATGTPLPADGGEPIALCAEYLAAVHATDVPKLRSLVSRQSKATFDNVDWEYWHKIRPVEITGFEGYIKDNRCTLNLVGNTRGNFTIKWNYQLEREEGKWKVVREDWDTSEIRKQMNEKVEAGK